MCVKNTTYNGKHVELPIGKTSTLSRKKSLLALIKKIVTSILPLTFIGMPFESM